MLRNRPEPVNFCYTARHMREDPPLLTAVGGFAALEPLACSPRLGLITDFDGTISPIVATPQAAGISPVAQRALAALGRTLPLVAVVSGRPAAEVARLVGLPGLVYIGNHGLERYQRGQVLIEPTARPYLPALAETLAGAERALPLPGLLFEDKGVTLSIHYRQAAQPARARERILATLASLPAAQGLVIKEGKKVIEVRPPVQVDKGTAVRELLDADSLSAALYLGDDSTDVDAFQALHAWGEQTDQPTAALAVLSAEVPEAVRAAADFGLNGVPVVEQLLSWLAAQTGQRDPGR